jgi:phosphonate transport system substrate-binding protein
MNARNAHGAFRIARTWLAETFAALLTSVIFMGQVAAQQGAPQPPPWRMALIPYLSPNVLIPLFQPLASHFGKDTGRSVELYSAPSIRAHVDRIVRPDFDIIFTAPHLGRLSQVDGGYIPIGSFERPLTGVITVRNDSPIRQIDQLRGKTIAINDRLVLNSILTLSELEKRGIRLADITIAPAVSQNSALLSVVAGDVDAAITVNFAIGQIPKEKQGELRILFQTEENPDMPSTLILVHPSMRSADRQRLEASLQGFAGTDEGKRFLQASNYKNVVRIVPANLKKLDVYLPELRRLLAIKPGN